MTPLFFALMIVAEPLSYSGKVGAPLEQFMFTTYEPGATIAIASDRARVREAPDAKAKVVAELPLGEKVKILERAKTPVRNDERVDHWYKIDQGWIFGAALSPLVYAIDFDGDGETEQVSVTWTWNFKVKVRVVEPALPAASRELSLEFEPGGQAFVCCGGVLNVEAVPKSAAGIALLSVASNVEACADYLTTWISYSSPGPKKAGKLAKALEASGMADPPVHSEFKVAFDPKQTIARVARETWEDGENDGEKLNVEKSEQVYVLKDGVFVEKN